MLTFPHFLTRGAKLVQLGRNFQGYQAMPGLASIGIPEAIWMENNSSHNRNTDHKHNRNDSKNKHNNENNHKNKNNRIIEW